MAANARLLAKPIRARGRYGGNARHLGSPVSGQLRKLNIAYTATSPYQAPLIIAREAGFFKKHGLDIAPILTPGGSLGFQAMMGGDVSMVLADGSAAVTSSLAGADIIIIASFLNTFPYSLISLPEIKKVDQLVGGRVRAPASRGGSQQIVLFLSRRDVSSLVAICVINVIFAWRWLPESNREPVSSTGQLRKPLWHPAYMALRHPGTAISRLLWIYGVGMLASPLCSLRTFKQPSLHRPSH